MKTYYFIVEKVGNSHISSMPRKAKINLPGAARDSRGFVTCYQHMQSGQMVGEVSLTGGKGDRVESAWLYY
jgi:hypothetical protein